MKGGRPFSTLSGLYLLSGLLGKLSRFLLLPAYAWFLTPSEFGAIVFLDAIVVASARFLSFGLHHAVKRYYVDFEVEHEGDRYAANLWWASVVFAAVFGTGMVLALGQWNPAVSVSSGDVALAVAAGACASTLHLPLQRLIAREEAGLHGVWTFAPSLTTAIAVLISIILCGSVTAVMWANIGGYLVWSSIGAAVVGRWFDGRTLLADLGPALRYSLPILPHTLFTWGITFFDRLLLERHVALAEVASYGLGYQLASVLPLVSLALVNSNVAAFFKTAASAEGRDSFVGRAMFALASIVTLAIAAALSAPEIVAVVSGGRYPDAILIMQIVLVGLAFHGVYQLLLLPLLVTKSTYAVPLTSGVAFGTNLFLNLWLIPTMGGLGAAIATVGAYVVAALVAGVGVAAINPLRFPALRCAGLIVMLLIAAVVSLTTSSFGGRGWSAAVRFSVAIALTSTLWLSASVVPDRERASARRELGRMLSQLSARVRGR